MLHKTLAIFALSASIPFASMVAFHTVKDAHTIYKHELVKSLPVSVSIPSAEIEIDFVPTHSLYQKRCLVNGELVYCANTDALATVTVVQNEVEIDFIADAE